MDKINRVLVKSQAKQIIKGKVFILFLISFVVSILTGGVTFVYNITSSLEDITDSYDNYYSDDYFDDYDDNYYFNFYYNRDDNPIESFNYSSKNSNTQITDTALSNGATKQSTLSVLSVIAGLGGLASVITLILSPLAVTLAGMYVSLIKRNVNAPFYLGKELGGIFKDTFNETYGKKLVVCFLVKIITGLLGLLFIIPGIVFRYSAYFTYQIMCDNSNLKPSEAIKLSKKIVKGNRTELFEYDLSFIPWYLLTCITFGLVNIYVMPYKSTTDALYYENFRLRALAEGKVIEDDFLSEQERIMKYNSVGYGNGYQQNPYYSPYADNAQAQNTNNAEYSPYQATQQSAMNNDGTFYTPDLRPPEQFNPYVNPAQPNQTQGNPYYNSPADRPQTQYYQPSEPYQAQQQYYRPPVEKPEEQSSSPSYYNPPQKTEYTDSADDSSNTDNNEQ